MSRDEHPESDLTRRAREAMAGLSDMERRVLLRCCGLGEPISRAAVGQAIESWGTAVGQAIESLRGRGLLAYFDQPTDLGREVARLLSEVQS